MTTATVTQLNPGEPTFDRVLVTPELAQTWLTKNTHNRSIRKRAVADYARDMANGSWVMNGEAIKFATDGTLLDGQHRLHAVVESGVTVPMLVVTGLPSTAQETMDAGRKRVAADVLSLRGEANPSALASVLRRVWMWDAGNRSFSGGASAPTMADLSELLGRRPEIRRSAEIAVRVHGQFTYIPQSMIGTAHHVFSRVSVDDAVWFFARLGDGAELPVAHPVLTLRQRIMTDRGAQKRIPEERCMAYMVRAWNACRSGRSLDRIIHAPGAQMPEPQ